MSDSPRSPPRRPLSVARALALSLASGVVLTSLPGVAIAHEPIAHCVLLDARTVRCKAGYGHGEGAPDATMDVLAQDGRTLVAGKLDRDSTLTFTRPTERFYVIFDVGPGHQAVVEDDEIAPPPPNARAGWMQPPEAARTARVDASR